MRRTVHISVHAAQRRVKPLQLSVQHVSTEPHVKLVCQFRDDEERPPAADLLRFEDVAEDVVADVQHVFTLRADELREYITGTWPQTRSALH